MHASQPAQMKGLAKLSRSSAGLAAAQAVSCPGWIFHDRCQVREVMGLISGRSS